MVLGAVCAGLLANCMLLLCHSVWTLCRLLAPINILVYVCTSAVQTGAGRTRPQDQRPLLSAPAIKRALGSDRVSFKPLKPRCNRRRDTAAKALAEAVAAAEQEDDLKPGKWTCPEAFVTALEVCPMCSTYVLANRFEHFKLGLRWPLCTVMLSFRL